MENTPIFVKIEKYKEIVKIVDLVNAKLSEIEHSIQELKEMKKKEDAQIERWEEQLETVNEKMSFINETLKEM